jgi:Ran GTPase-activating protein (RanGAP) involved in mRNA processing and transport
MELVTTAHGNLPLSSRGCPVSNLFLFARQISDDGASAIGRQLPANLKILDMSDNDVADVGVQVISRAIIDSRLEKVVLANNKIGDSGATALSQAVTQSLILYELDLTWNEIGDEGATSLARGLVPTLDGTLGSESSACYFGSLRQ